MATSTSQPNPLTDRPNTAIARLSFFDGLRGLAALYVVLYHTREQYNSGAPLHDFLSHSASILTGWMRQGHLAVDAFIVLSGYCLMLPVARSVDGHLKGGVFGYLKRRARRIVPPYYAALIISFLPLVVAQLHHGGGQQMSAAWRYNFTAFPLLTHLFLVHNITLGTTTLYDPPMWSVSTEWEIYFLFPLLLLVLRRAGIWISVLTAIVLGLLPHFLLPAENNLDWACPWFLGLFALGMLGAQLSLTENVGLRKLGAWLPWGIVSLVLFIPGFWLGLTDSPYVWGSDLLVGASAAAFLVSCYRASQNSDTARAHAPLRLLTSPLVVRLGVFSYSLYLIHSLVTIYLGRFLQQHPGHHLASPVLFFPTCLLISLGLSYLFFLAIERRCLPGHLHNEKRDVAGTVLSPAP